MSALAGCMGEICSISLDTAKVRLQLQKSMPGKTGGVKYTSAFQAIPRMALDEGPRALFNGLTPGLCRQAIFIGIGNGLYVPLRNAIMVASGKSPDTSKATILQKITAGMMSGAIGVTLGHPFEVVKVRLQTQGIL